MGEGGGKGEEKGRGEREGREAEGKGRGETGRGGGQKEFLNLVSHLKKKGAPPCTKM